MNELDYWTGFRDALESLRGDFSKFDQLLRSAREKVIRLRENRP